MLVFSVKGEDLLLLDYANAKISPEDRKKYEALGLQAALFPNARSLPRCGPAACPKLSEALPGHHAARP